MVARQRVKELLKIFSEVKVGVLVAQRFEHPTGVTEVVSLIPTLLLSLRDEPQKNQGTGLFELLSSTQVFNQAFSTFSFLLKKGKVTLFF